MCDGCRPTALPDWWEIREVGPKMRHEARDNKQAGWVAIRAAADARQALLFLEDDVRPLEPGAFSRMATHLPAADFASFYHPRRAPGIYEAGSFDLSQALLLPARSVAWLAQAADIARGDWDAISGVDIAIAQYGRAVRWKFEQLPNLVDHVGVVSACFPPGLPRVV